MSRPNRKSELNESLGPESVEGKTNDHDDSIDEFLGKEKAN